MHCEWLLNLCRGLVEKERAKNTKDTAKNPNGDVRKTLMGLSHPEHGEKFSVQLGTEPYTQLGTGERCKVEGCSQPVYDKKLGLCSYHRMKQAEKAFEGMLRARQRQTGGESRTR
jgi:hypothetical protein